MPETLNWMGFRALVLRVVRVYSDLILPVIWIFEIYGHNKEVILPVIRIFENYGNNKVVILPVIPVRLKHGNNPA